MTVPPSTTLSSTAVAVPRQTLATAKSILVFGSKPARPLGLLVCSCGAFAIMPTLTGTASPCLSASPHDFPLDCHSFFPLFPFSFPFPSLSFPLLTPIVHFPKLPPSTQTPDRTTCLNPPSVPFPPSRTLLLVVSLLASLPSPLPHLLYMFAPSPKSGCKSETCQQPSQSTIARDRFLISHRYCHFGGIESWGAVTAGGGASEGERQRERKRRRGTWRKRRRN